IYAGARWVSGMVLEQRITQAFQELGYESKHQVELRAYQRGVLSSLVNLVVDSPLIRGVIRARITHGPLFDPPSSGTAGISLAGVELTIPPSAYMTAIRAELTGPAASLLPQPRINDRELPSAVVDARLAYDGAVSGRIVLPDFDHQGNGGDTLRWRGFDAVFDSLPGDGPAYYQIDLGRWQSADAWGRSLSFEGGVLDGEISAPGDPRSRRTMGLYLGPTQLHGRDGDHLAMDAFELQRKVAPGSDWLREFDVAIPKAVHRSRDGELANIELAANAQITHINAVQWSNLLNDLRVGSEAVVWSELAESGAEFRLSHLNVSVNGKQGESYGLLRLKPLGDNEDQPWNAVNGKLFLEFNRDVLDILVRWGMAPYFTGAIESERLSGSEAGVEELLEVEIANLVQQGLLRTRSGDRFATIITAGADGPQVNGQTLNGQALNGQTLNGPAGSTD
ncbi:MAG: DUF945 family protein, partial [Gammaproteobacteria bacterium]